MTCCTTRLRLTLHDEGKADIAEIEKLDHVQGVYVRFGQHQIIFGIGIVNKVYQALEEAIARGTETPEQPTAAEREKLHPFVEITKTVSNIFIPIIPVMVASGLLMGLSGMIKSFRWTVDGSAWIRLLDIFSTSAFIILPIIIGFSAAKQFGSNPYLGAVIGGILTHPDLLNRWMLIDPMPDYLNVFGMPVPLIGYQGTVIPAILSVYLMSKAEKGLRRLVPRSFDLLLIPFVIVIVTGIVSILAIGPLGEWIGRWMTNGVDFIYKHGGVVAGILLGGLYSSIVFTGLHHVFLTVEVGLLADPQVGMNLLLPIWAMANVAQGGAGLAVFVKTRNQKLKNIAIPASITAFLGVVEPVIYGMNLRLRTPFIGASIGGAAGGAYVVSNHVAANSIGLSGIPMIAIAAPLGVPNLLHYLIGFAVSAVFGFLATWIVGFDDVQEE